MWQSLSQLDQNKPLYLAIANAVRAAIANDILQPEDKLPSAAQLTSQFKCNRHTVMKALAELVAEGYVDTKERRGYFVHHNLPVERQRTAGNTTPNVTPIKLEVNLPTGVESLPSYPSSAHSINFTGGLPDISLFPFQEFKSFMAEELTRPNIEQLQYGHVAGEPRFIEQMASYLRLTRQITNKSLMITNGTQEGLYLVSQLLLKAGDCVLMEELSYPPAKATFCSVGAKVKTIKQNVDGLDLAHLASLIANNKVRLLYLTPLHQYPTTTTIPIAKRLQIYQLCKQHNVVIIEDDYDHEYHYESQPQKPMASDDPYGIVIYMASMSKLLFPGARLGVLAVPESLIQPLLIHRQLISHKPNVLQQGALARWMDSGGFHRHLRRTTRQYHLRYINALQQIELSRLFDCEKPKGGMALWVKLQTGISASKIAQKANSQGIYLQHQQQFVMKLEYSGDSYLRLGFAGMNEKMFTNGIQLLAEIINGS